ncbi:MAG: hypothetical protein JNG84_05995 [Archangium sp.]|nr:hypothetical protein [Archangium sp.]
MASMRVVMNFMVGGGLLGIIGSTFAGPSILEWYNTSGAGPSLCECAKLTRDTADRFVTIQLAGLGAGAFAGLVLGVLFAAKRRNTPPPAASAA